MKALLLFILSFNLWAEEMIIYPKQDKCLQVGEYVFNASERAFLKKLDKKIACAQKVSVQKINKKIKRLFHLEENGVFTLMQTQDTYESEQWAIANLGQSWPFVIDDLTTLSVPAKKGEDINILPLREGEAGKNIVVAVLDTGIDLNHPDLEDQVLVKPSECKVLFEYKECLVKGPAKDCEAKYAKVDTDNNGYPMDCSGFNVAGKLNRETKILGDQDVQDKIGHGTHVSGIIAAALNGTGVVGVAPKAKILPVKVLNAGPSGPERPLSFKVPFPREGELPRLKTYGDIFARGLLYAIRSGAHVVNMSLGWPFAVESELMRALVKIALDKKMILIASAGNDSTSVPLFPCNYTGVICVGAHDAYGSFATFSNYGANVDILAPGTRILSTYPLTSKPDIFNEDVGYEFDQGTSMSAPFVAGAAAVLLSEGVQPDEIYPRLVLSSRSINKSPDPRFSIHEKFIRGGNLDIYSALKQAPMPFIVLNEKGQKLKTLDGTELKFRVQLKNIWKSTSVGSLRLLALDKITKDSVDIMSDRFDFSSWETNSAKTFEFIIKPKHLLTHAELSFMVSVSTEEGVQNIPYQLELVSTFNTVKEKWLYSLDLSPEELTPTLKFRTIEGLLDHYLLVDEGEDATKLKLIVKTKETYTLKAQTLLPKLEGEWNTLKLLGEQFVLIRKVKLEEKKIGLVFSFFDLDLNLIREEKVDASVAPLSLDLSFILKNGLYYPVWIALGESLRSKPFDPWDPAPEKEMNFFLYSLENNIVRSFDLKLAEDQFLVSLLPQSSKEAAKGELYVITGKGALYDFKFELARFHQGKLEFKSELIFPVYHMIGGAQAFKSSHQNFSYFANDRYITQINTSGESLQNRLKSINDLIQIQKIQGVFLEGAFLQTQNELIFQSFQDNQIDYLSLKRFSFMPNYFFDKFFYPVRVKGNPSLYVPSGLGVSLTNDFIALLNNDGESKLIRPAEYRIMAPAECLELNPKISDKGFVFNYYCQKITQSDGTIKQNVLVEIPF